MCHFSISDKCQNDSFFVADIRRNQWASVWLCLSKCCYYTTCWPNFPAHVTSECVAWWSQAPVDGWRRILLQFYNWSLETTAAPLVFGGGTLLGWLSDHSYPLLCPGYTHLPGGRHAGTDNMGTHVMFCNMELFSSYSRSGTVYELVVQATHTSLVDNMLGQTTWEHTSCSATWSCSYSRSSDLDCSWIMLFRLHTPTCYSQYSCSYSFQNYYLL